MRFWVAIGAVFGAAASLLFTAMVNKPAVAPPPKLVRFSLAGQESRFLTRAADIGEFLSRQGVVLGPKDRVFPSMDEPLLDGQKLRVDRVQALSYVEKKVSRPRTEKRFTTHLAPGEKKLYQKGEPRVVYEKVLVYKKNGQVTFSKVVERKVAKEGRPEIVLVGKPMMVAARKRQGVSAPSRAPAAVQVPEGATVVKTLRMQATSYHPTKCLGCDGSGLTATGHLARRGVVAVDPRVIPLGTRLYIEGYGYATALDVGSAIKGHRIDLCFETVEEVYRFGRRPVTVHVLK